MRTGRLYDLLAPVYGRIAPSLSGRVTLRAIERLGAVTPDSVLEVGMGPGGLVRELQTKTTALVVGVDMAKGMVGQAKKKVHQNEGRVNLVRADGLSLPFGESTFESVVSLFFLDVLDEDAARVGLEEMSRVVVPGGRIVIGSLHFSSNFLQRSWMLTYRVLPELVGRIRPIAVQELGESVGLRTLREEEVDDVAGATLTTLMKVRG